MIRWPTTLKMALHQTLKKTRMILQRYRPRPSLRPCKLHKLSQHKLSPTRPCTYWKVSWSMIRSWGAQRTILSTKTRSKSASLTLRSSSEPITISLKRGMKACRLTRTSTTTSLWTCRSQTHYLTRCCWTTTIESAKWRNYSGSRATGKGLYSTLAQVWTTELSRCLNTMPLDTTTLFQAAYPPNKLLLKQTVQLLTRVYAV